MAELDQRLSAVIEAPCHGAADVAAFQSRFTASAWEKDGGAIFIAEDTHAVPLGYINVREGRDEIADEPCAYIALLAVTPQAEGKGVAVLLCDAAENWAAELGYSRIALDVFASNARARSFYRRAGFECETQRLVKRIGDGA